MSKKPTLKAVSRRNLFGPSPVLEGEDAAAYDELLDRVRAAVNPVDIVEEMLITDVMYLEWDVLRWRRVKTGLLRGWRLNALKGFLSKLLDYSDFQEKFQMELFYILQTKFAEDEVEEAAQLAADCAAWESDACREVRKILAEDSGTIDSVMDFARARKAEEVVQEYVRTEQGAVNLVNKLLASAGVTIDDLVAEALVKRQTIRDPLPNGEEKRLEYIEQIDRQAAIAERRRDDSLRGIYRRRAVLGETLRRSVQEIEDSEFKVIETTPTKRKNAA